MDITPSHQQLLAQLKPLLKAQNLEQALTPGNRLSATVEKVTEVTPELRARLLRLFVESKGESRPNNTALANANTKTGATDPTANLAKNSTTHLAANTQTPQANTLANTVSSLPELLNSQLLKLLEVKVLNTKLLLLSQLALPAKTVLKLEVRQDGQLQYVNKPETSSNPLKPGAALYTQTKSVGYTSQNLLSGQTSSSPAGKSESFNNNVIASNTPKNRSETLPHEAGLSAQKRIESNQQLHLALKTYLPLQQNLAQSLNQLQKVMSATESTNLTQTLPKLAPILNELKILLDKIPSASELNHSQKVRTSIESSGVFLESSLKKLNEIIKTTNSATTNNTGKPTPASSSTTLTSDTGPKPKKTIDDVKASLLRLIDDLQHLQPKAPNGTTTHAKSSSVDSLIRNIFSFSQSTQSEKTPKNENTKQQLSQNIARTLHTTIFSAVARISQLQIQQLLQQEGAQPSQGFNVEIPLKFGEQLLPLSLIVHEKWHDERDKDQKEDKHKNKKQKLKKRWHVFMEFDLGEYGSFASEISLQKASVNTTLWVQQTRLWETTHAHIGELKSELEKNGIEVESITLHKGKAPEKPLQLNQSLVDIRT
ncbi:MAG: flagellar hook-length control protein FliK [Agarilytica sp.]